MTSLGSTSKTYPIRVATCDDIDTLIDLRVAMFEAMGVGKDDVAKAVCPMRAYFEEHLPTGAFRVWVAEHHGEAIASIGLVIHSIPPSPKNLVGKEAYIMNLVTRQEYRRRGIARQLMQHAIATIRNEEIPLISLHASTDGQHLYEQLGFAVSDELPEMTLGTMA